LGLSLCGECKQGAGRYGIDSHQSAVGRGAVYQPDKSIFCGKLFPDHQIT
jgi:hypothetical protein